LIKSRKNSLENNKIPQNTANNGINECHEIEVITSKYNNNKQGGNKHVSVESDGRRSSNQFCKENDEFKY